MGGQFFQTIHAKEERNRLSIANQGCCTVKPRCSHAVSPFTSPCPNFLLTQHLSPKDIAGNNITRLKQVVEQCRSVSPYEIVIPMSQSMPDRAIQGANNVLPQTS